MSDRTRIAWTDATWNPFTGCTPISEGCEHCYAERMAGRNLAATRCPECSGSGIGLVPGLRPHDTLIGPCDACDGSGNVGFKPTFHPGRLDTPLHWRKPRRVFVCSMSDMFHDRFTDWQRDQVFQIMAKANQHTFMLLTKRPWRMQEYVAKAYPAKSALSGRTWPLSNVWLGVTVDTQANHWRLDDLGRTPAALKFVSYEPALGPFGGVLSWLGWAVVGGETGPGARPVQPEWALDVWRQCKEAGVPFFFKQPGTWLKREIEAGRYTPTDEYREMESTQEFPKGEA